MREAVIVQLKTDLKNPHVDRRSKDWNRLPVINAGHRFIVRGDTISSSDHRYAWEGQRSALGKLILDNSDPVEPKSVKELKEFYGVDWSDDGVLRILLKLGKIKPEDFAEVAAVPDDF